MFYEVEMLDTKTGKQYRFQMDRSIGWADGPNGSIWGWQNRMCDCNLHPYFAECICPKCGLRHGGSNLDGGF